MNDILKERTSTMQTTSIRDDVEERIDLRTGRLVLDYTDFEWGGELMPVSIHHVYNSSLSDARYTRSSDLAVADFSAMNLGLGWKLNIMQSMYPITENGVTKYYYTDADGNTTEFVLSESSGNYVSKRDSEAIYDPLTGMLTWGNYRYSFENYRLVGITDTDRNVAMRITYSNGRITHVYDASDRCFMFKYTGGRLTSIVAPDNTAIVMEYDESETRLYSFGFNPDAYDDNFVYQAKYTIQHTDGETGITICDENGIQTYERAYTFNSSGKVTKRKTEYFNVSMEPFYEETTEYAYSANHTEVKVCEPAANPVTTVYSFDTNGEISSSHVVLSSTERVENLGGTTPFNPYCPNQAYVGFTTENLICDPSFKTTTAWTRDFNDDESFSSACVCTDEENAYYGRNSLIMSTTDPEGFEEGYVQEISDLPAGTYTFSAYVKIANTFAYTGQTSGLLANGVYLGVICNGEMLNVSESVGDSEIGFARIGTTFTLSGTSNVALVIRANGAGCAYVSAPQLENNDWYNEVNLLEKASATESQGTVVNETVEGFGKPGCISIYPAGYIKKTYVPKSNASTLESFVFSAWAKAVSVPAVDEFRLRAVIKYANGTTESGDNLCASFSNSSIWNKAEVYFSKSKFLAVDSIDLYCEALGSTSGAFYFDDVALVRVGIEKGLTAEDFEEPEEDSSEETENAEQFEEVKDSRGNILTETVFKDGCVGALYRSFEYSSLLNGNDKISETDHRGNTTSYSYDLESARITSVTDRLGNRTDYTYDSLGRITKAELYNSDNEEISVSYEYDEDGKLCKIINGYTEALPGSNITHNFDYNKAGLLVNADGMISYDYRENSGRLKSMTYSNGWTASLSYDRFGRIVSEKWTNSTSTPVYEYIYAYDKAGNLVRSVDKTALKEYTYTYQNDTITRLRECSIVLDSSNNVTARTPVNTIHYFYDDTKQLSKKICTAADLTSKYSSTEYTNTVKHTKGSSQIDSVTTTTDHLGRVTSEEVIVGEAPVVFRSFEYLAGVVSTLHTDNNKVPSTPTTNLVEKITEGNRTLTYTYDAEERVTSCIDSRGFNHAYTYNSQGNLVREVLNGTDTVYEYDRFGNIKDKGTWDSENNCYITDDNRISLSYSSYKYLDTVVRHNGDTIEVSSLEYDALGNPVKYKDGIELAWEKGRQLKSYGNLSNYTYNANGIRTSKTYTNPTNGAVKNYVYELEGTKIVRMTEGNNSLVPLYDASNSPIGIIYNSTPYWFFKNLQGDILAIKDETGYEVVRYVYDAWGKVKIQRDTTEFKLSRINPFLWRGYIYDYDTGLYYLQSRYYDPELCRFLNPDDPAILLLEDSISPNVYAYCHNDPVNMVDPTGYYAPSLVLPATTMSALSAASYDIMASIGASLAGIKTSISTSWLVPVCIAAAALASAGIVYLINRVNHLFSSAKQTISAVKSQIKKNGVDEDTLGNYTVYVIYVPVYDVVYVGITKRYVKRHSQHTGTGKRFSNDKYTMVPIATSLSKEQARAMEQAIITAYTLVTLDNMINSISPKKWKNFKSEFEQVETLFESWIDSE